MVNGMDLRAGLLVTTLTPEGVTHFGIVTESGNIISNSKLHERVVEQYLEDFAGHGGLRIVGFPTGGLPPHVAVRRARARLGSSYSLLSNNCEDFWHECYGFERQSPQRDMYLAFGMLAVL
jgi:hypothetical protein